MAKRKSKTAVAKRTLHPTRAKGQNASHRAVSNQPVSVVSPKRKIVHPWTLGHAGPRHPTARGYEAVAGRQATPVRADYESPAVDPATAAANPPRWVAPQARLRDIATASFGPPATVLESVMGVDERTQITDTLAYPWRAIASLLIVARDNSNWVGTAWFISPRTLATAGHCVFINSPVMPERHGWVKSITVMPGRNGAALPFGAATSTEFKSVDGWTTAGDSNHDYAAIILPVPLGTRVGTFGFGVFPDDDLKTVDANISGYPADKDPGTQWFDHRQVVQVNPTKVFYDVDTAGGQSGAPVWRVNGQVTTAVAIHAYGVGGGIQSNSGTRITQEVYDNLHSWML